MDNKDDLKINMCYWVAVILCVVGFGYLHIGLGVLCAGGFCFLTAMAGYHATQQKPDLQKFKEALEKIADDPEYHGGGPCGSNIINTSDSLCNSCIAKKALGRDLGEE